MDKKVKKGDVVQFVENHKWIGCFGYVNEIKHCGDDIRYMIGVPMPSNDGDTKTAFIFSMGSKAEFEHIGKAILIPGGDEDE